MTFRLSSIALFLVSALYLVGQTPANRGAAPEEAPGGIVLLPGYQHERLQGIDSRVGRISNSRGFEIRYDIGTMAGNYAQNPQGRVWLKEQVVGANRVQIKMADNRMMTVTFSAITPGAVLPANFYATVKNDEDVVEMLLMALSYKPS